jgi:hypothetical protein
MTLSNHKTSNIIILIFLTDDNMQIRCESGRDLVLNIGIVGYKLFKFE